MVDNASTDGTAELLAGDYADLRRRAPPANTGGAGGFAVGHRAGADPRARPGLAARRRHGARRRRPPSGWSRAWAAYAGPAAPRAGRQPGGVDRRPRPPDEHPAAQAGRLGGRGAAAAAVGCVPIRSASFVSIMCDADDDPRARAAGRRLLPLERRLRVLHPADPRRGRPVLPRSVGGRTRPRTFGSTDADPGERFFYEVRNKVWMFTRSTGLVTRGEGAVRRLDRCAAGRAPSRARSDRRTLAAGSARGSPPGLRTRPARQRRGARRGRLVADDGDDRADRPRAAVLPAAARCTAATTPTSCATRSSRASTTRPAARRGGAGPGRPGPATSWPTTIAELVADEPGAGRPRRDRGERRARARPRPRAGAPATHEIVARMDADDVEPARPVREAAAAGRGGRGHRAARAAASSGPSVDDVVGRRTPPTDPDEIRRVIRFRDPFNHPTVVYRRSAVQAAGGYTDMALMEDYLLFARMVDGGRAAGQPRRAAGAATGSVRAPTPGAAGGAAALGAGPAAPVPRARASPRARQYLRNVVVRGGYRLVPEGCARSPTARLIANRGAGKAAARLRRAGRRRADAGPARRADRLDRCCPVPGACVER